MARTITHQIAEDETTPAMLGEKEHLEVAQNNTFTQTILEMLLERDASSEEVKIMDLIFNLCVDHGPNSPSALATITATKEGKAFGESVGLGIHQINETHGGAIEPAMEFFYKIKNEGANTCDLVKEYLDEHKLIAGYGHRVYKDNDPRAELIFKKLHELGLGDEYIKIAKEVKEALEEQKQKSLPINIDGAIAVVLCTFNWDSKISKAVFIIPRVVGLSAHHINHKNSRIELESK